jgi:hypothetical protein
MATTTSYRTRAIRPLGVRELAGWRMKMYGIAAVGERPREAVVAAASELAAKVLPAPPHDDGPGAYGFVIAHEGESACYYLVYWWVQEIFLGHRIFVASLRDPRRWQPVGAGVFPCAWELVPIAHEREAWVAAMLQGEPDPQRYLADTVSRDA